MNIYGSLMDIFDKKNKNFFDERTKTFLTKERITCAEIDNSANLTPNQVRLARETLINS